MAVVNGSVITRADFDRELTSALGRLSSTGEPVAHSQLSQLKEEVFKKLIARELLYQESQNNGIKVNEAAINEQLVMLKKDFLVRQNSRKSIPSAPVVAKVEIWVTFSGDKS